MPRSITLARRHCIAITPQSSATDWRHFQPQPASGICGGLIEPAERTLISGFIDFLSSDFDQRAALQNAAEIISKFAAIDVNLTKLESRPMPGMDFEFRFIFDFMASPQENAVQCLLSELSRDPEIEHFDFLGAYVES